MSLQLILGNAGSGKTGYINRTLIKEAMESPGKQFIALVPEQFTMEAQKALVELHPGRCVLNIDILSFERLAYRVFEELSFDPGTVLDDTGKSMLLRKACASVEKELEIYGKHLDRPGFIEELKSLISELGQYRLGEEELSGLVEKTEKRTLLNRKLKDIRLLLRAFRETMGEGMITAEELLPVLCRVLPRSKRVRNAVIAVDGFIGFTPAQYEVLGLLLRYGERVSVAVTIDPEAEPFSEKAGEDLFALSRKTIASLLGLAKESGAGRERDVILKPERLPRYSESPELEALSRRLFRYPCKGLKGKPKSVFCGPEASPSAEAKALAKRIGSLVKEEGYRYREIAVICGDLEQYRPLLEHAFYQAGIPVFLDDKRSLLTNPAVEYMRAALEVIEKDFSYESVFRYLKCGFSALEEEALFELENYVLALGIRGSRRWAETWDRIYRGGEHVNLEKLNQARKQAAEPLLILKDRLREKGADVRRMTEALFQWLDGQQAAGKLSAMAEQFRQEAQYSLAKEYEQAYGQILELFDRTVGLLGNETLPLKTYREVLDAGFQEIRVGVIPEALDELLVGDLERSRLGRIRALFFIGANEGSVPKPGKQGGLLSELDRTALSAYAELAPSGRESSRREKLYFYLAAARPSERLYVSWAAAGDEGEKKAPSPYAVQLFRVFPELSGPPQDMEGALTPQLAFKALAEGMEQYRRGCEPKSWDALYSCLSGRKEDQELLLEITDAAFYSYDGEQISRAAARALYGDPLSGSVTRLETYAACACAQFLTYGLALAERREFEFAALDMGNVFHKALELCFVKAGERGIALGELSEEQRRGLVKESMAEAAASLGNRILESSARNEYLARKMERITEKTVWALGEQLKAGSFQPAAFELTFSPGENETMRVSLEGGSMELRGKIDRVDLYENEGQVYVKIIDYKSGGTDFDLGGVYHGLQLQLAVYLDAVMKKESREHPGKEIVPAGMFYYQIRDPLLEREQAAQDVEDAVLSALRPRGVFEASGETVRLLQKEGGDGASRWLPASFKDGRPDPKRSGAISREQFENLRKFVRKKIRELGNGIISGDVSARPYKRQKSTGCDYCRFQAVCGFDRKAPGYGYRNLKEPEPEKIWEEMAGESDGSGMDS